MLEISGAVTALGFVGNNAWWSVTFASQKMRGSSLLMRARGGSR